MTNDDSKKVKNSNEETSQQPQQQKKTDSDYDNVTGDEEQQEEEEGENDVENIQDNKEQGYLEEQFGFNSTSINPFEEPTLKGGHIALIFASALVLLSILAYVGLGWFFQAF